MAVARIGISGWRYAPWRGEFYPKGLPQRRELEYASSKLNSIELNGTFYSLQKPEYFRAWAAETPEDFVFPVKAPRYITHLLKLKRSRVPVANFLASGPLALGAKLGPVLWQLPPQLAFDEVLLDEFLGMLPHTTTDAAKLATEHDERLDGRDWVTTDAERPLRHAVEVRHPSFVDERWYALLEKHRAASVVADTAGKWPKLDELTADFAYARLHGDTELYVSGYDDDALDRWAATVQGWLDSGRDAYVYFDNDVKVRAPFDAMGLKERLRRS